MKLGQTLDNTLYSGFPKTNSMYKLKQSFVGPLKMRTRFTDWLRINSLLGLRNIIKRSINKMIGQNINRMGKTKAFSRISSLFLSNILVLLVLLTFPS